MSWVEQLPSGKYRGAYRDRAGKTHRSPAMLHKTAAKQWAADREHRSRAGHNPAAGRMLFADWAAGWWEARVVAETTHANDQHRYDAVVEEWGDWPLEAITTMAVQGWVKRLAKTKAPATVAKYRGLLSAILTAAVRERIVADNAARHVAMPQVPKGREVYLTREQVDKLVAQMPRPYDTAALVLAYTGLRWGELAGLTVRRLDLLRGTVQVAETMIEIDGRRTPKPYPKTSRSFRTVPLPPEIVEALAGHLAAFPAKRDGLVFRGVRGGPMSRHHFSRTVHKACEAAGVPDCRPHDLRHSYASWLVQAGVPLAEVQRLLGHESITTTERYSHLAEDRFDRALSALARGAPVEQPKRKDA